MTGWLRSPWTIVVAMALPLLSLAMLYRFVGAHPVDSGANW